jgi:hypothetical protein
MEMLFKKKNNKLYEYLFAQNMFSVITSLLFLTSFGFCACKIKSLVFIPIKNYYFVFSPS